MDVVDDYHGTKIADPYRWLEDPDSEKTRAWIAAQNRTTRAFLDAVPERAPIRKRLEELWNYARWSAPVKKGGRYFFSKNDGLQAQPVYCVATSLDAAPRVLLDPNLLSKDGTVALGVVAPSEDGKLLAYEIADAGSDWTPVKGRDVDSGRARTSASSSVFDPRRWKRRIWFRSWTLPVVSCTG